MTPPWLWFWAAVWLLNLRTTWRATFGGAISAAALQRAQNEEMRLGHPRFGQLDFLLIPGYFLEFTVVLAVLAGLLVALLPFLRGRYVIWRYKLEPPPESLTVVGDIRTFLEERGAKLDVRVNMRRARQAAFIYPVGYRKSGLALFPSFLKLWRGDREAAEAVLTHELAHHRRGDTLVIGAGSFLEAFARRSIWLFLVLVMVPLVTIAFWDTVNGQGRYNLGTLLLNQGLSLLATLAYFLALLTILLAAIWDAEFNADNAVLESQGTREPLLRGLVMPSGTHWLAWLMQLLSHPPVRLRRWLMRRPDGLRYILLLLVFPLGYAVRLVLLNLANLLNQLATAAVVEKFSWSAYWQSVEQNSAAYARTSYPVLLAIGLVLLVWPFVRRALARGSDAGLPGGAYFISALPVLLVAALGFFAPAPVTSVAETAGVRVSPERVHVGEPFEACFRDMLGNALDWMTLVPFGSELDSLDDEWGQWEYLGEGVREGCKTYSVTEAGLYEVRVYLNNGFGLASRSPVVTVEP